MDVELFNVITTDPLIRFIFTHVNEIAVSLLIGSVVWVFSSKATWVDLVFISIVLTALFSFFE